MGLNVNVFLVYGISVTLEDIFNYEPFLKIVHNTLSKRNDNEFSNILEQYFQKRDINIFQVNNEDYVLGFELDQLFDVKIGYGVIDCKKMDLPKDLTEYEATLKKLFPENKPETYAVLNSESI